MVARKGSDSGAPDDSTPLREVELAGLLALASQRFASHGRGLFKLRAWALRATSLLGLLGIWFAHTLSQQSRPLALGVLGVFSLPALLCAPGLVAGTLAAARGEEPPERVFRSYAAHCLGIAALGLVRFVATLTVGLFVGPFALLVHCRLRFAEFLMLDEGLTAWAALGQSVRLTRGSSWATIELWVNEYFDAARYGWLRWQLDSRVRRALLDVLIYDALRKPAVSVVPSTQAVPRVPSPLPAPRAVVAAAAPPRVAAPRAPAAGLGCPRCGEGLLEYTDGDIRLLRCGSKHGVWASNAVSTRIVQARLPELVVREMAALDGEARFLHDPRDPIVCPQCEGPLATTWVPSAQLHVDVCAEHGTWFDAGELERVARGYQKASRDRAEIAELLAKPQVSAYRLGLPAMAAALGSTLREGVSTAASVAVDTAIEGREEDRADMWIRVLDAAVEISTRDDS